MATFTNSVVPVNTAASQFYNWAHPLAAFLSTAGWLQQNDTGQIAWPTSIFNITDANGNGTTVTFTGTIAAGASPIVAGQTILVSGTTNFGTVASPKRFVVTVGGTTTWSAASATNAHDSAIAANTGWGMVEQGVIVGNLTTLSVTGGVITFNFSSVSGTLRVGQSVVVLNTTSNTYDATYVITGGNLTSNFTANTGAGNVGSTACTSATASVACLPGCISTSESTSTTFPPANGSMLYEIWKMGDSNGFPLYLRIGYGTGSSGATIPEITVGIAASTDGAGNLSGGNTGNVILTNTNAISAVSTASYMSGSTNRLSMCLWTAAVAGAGGKGYFSIERSHDSTGADTTSYATLTLVGGISSSLTCSQISITSTGSTVNEIKIPSIVNHGANTGSFGSSTILSPAFPVVGAIGNPLYNTLVGKASDWTDQTQFNFTMYNTSRNYIIFTSALWVTLGIITYDASVSAALGMRYD